MNQDATIRGYRIVGEQKPDRQLSYEYLKQSADAAKALTALREAARTNGANCIGRESEFSGKTLMTPRDAQLECAGCPSFEECDFYKKVAHPAWGTWAGEVRGRGVMEEVEDEFDD